MEKNINIINGVKVVECYKNNMLNEIIINDEYFIKVYHNIDFEGNYKKGVQYIEIAQYIKEGNYFTENILCRSFDSYHGCFTNVNEAIEGLLSYL